jgi:hypothetical protein
MGVDDLISSTTGVPLSNPLEDRTWPPQSGDRNAWAAAGAVAPAGAPGLGIGTGRAMAFQAFQKGARALQAGDTKSGLEALEYAARNGEVMALWKLGRMYADDEGVKQSDQRAFEYFRGRYKIRRRASCSTNTLPKMGLPLPPVRANLAPRASCRKRSMAPIGPARAASGSRSAIQRASQ